MLKLLDGFFVVCLVGKKVEFKVLKNQMSVVSSLSPRVFRAASDEVRTGTFYIPVVSMFDCAAVVFSNRL
jgi:hypothetical protein